MATARINPRRIYNMVRGPIGESPSGGDAYEVKLYDAHGDLVTHHVDDRFVSNDHEIDTLLDPKAIVAVDEQRADVDLGQVAARVGQPGVDTGVLA